MRKDIATTRAAIAKITQMLAGKRIKVTQRGDQAYVRADPRTGIPNLVNIPYLPDNASEELVAAVQGYLDHEVAHLFETDFTITFDRKHPDFKKIDVVHNIVEDCWIEPRMAKRFKGSGFNLSNVRVLVFQQQGLEALNRFRMMGPMADERAATGMFLVVLLRALSGHQECIDFMDEHDVWSLFPTILPRLKTFFPDEIHACKSSADTLQLALKVFDVLKGMTPESDDDEEDERDSDKAEADGDEEGKGGSSKDDADTDDTTKDKSPGEDDDSEGGKSDGDDDESSESDSDDSEGDSGEGDEDEGDEDGDGAGDESDGEDEGDEDGDGAGDESDGEDEGDGDSAGGEEEDGDEDDASGGASGKGSAEGEGDSSEGDKGEKEEFDPTEICEDVTGVLEDMDDFAESVSKAARNLYLEAVESMGGSEWLTFTADYDKIEPYKLSSHFDQSWVQEMQDNVQRHIGPMQKEIERLILSKRRSLYQPGMRRGRINPSALHRLKVGDDRVFRIKHEQRDKNTAVKLLVDLSGSMGARINSKLDLAMQSAYGLAQTLERCRIAVDVTGFTTQDLPRNVVNELLESQRRIGREYSVIRESTYMPVFKSWNERLTSDVIKRFADMRFDPNKIRAENVDNVAVEYALRDLAQRTEERKILIVLSDGQPAFKGTYNGIMAARRELREAVAKGEKAGIETVGVGIMSTAVESYYPKHAVIRTVSELPTTLMAQLRAVLLK